MKKLLTLPFLDGFKDHGLLWLRIALGVSFVAHGYPKLAGGSERWEKLGSAMQHIGIDFGHLGFGLAATMTELIGGILLALGLATRPVSAALAFTMFVAMMMHIANDSGFVKISHPMELGIVFIAIFFMGPGRFSLDHRLLK